MVPGKAEVKESGEEKKGCIFIIEQDRLWVEVYQAK
jgi:hypothetical protein